MYTTWRLCPRAARYCRSPLTDAGTRQRSCKLPNGQRSAMQSTDWIDITTASRPESTASITMAASPPQPPAAEASPTAVKAATTCARGASPLSQPVHGCLQVRKRGLRLPPHLQEQLWVSGSSLAAICSLRTVCAAVGSEGLRGSV